MTDPLRSSKQQMAEPKLTCFFKLHGGEGADWTAAKSRLPVISHSVPDMYNSSHAPREDLEALKGHLVFT